MSLASIKPRGSEMSGSLKKSAVILLLSVGLGASPVHAECNLFCSTFAGSVATFVGSVVGVAFSVLPTYGALFSWKIETNCAGKELVCLDKYICDPPDEVPCQRVTQIDSYHFPNKTTECKKYNAFCVARAEPVTPLTVSTAYHKIWKPDEWAKVLFSVSVTLALFSGVSTFCAGPLSCAMHDKSQESDSSSTGSAEEEYLTLNAKYERH